MKQCNISSVTWSFPFKKKEIIKSEYIDLLHHDIPIFYSYTDSLDLIDSRGHKYSNFFEDTGYQVVMNKIKHLTQAEVNRQISVMKVSLGVYPSMVSKPVYHETLASIVSVQKTRSIEEREIFIREAERISDLLLDEAFIDQDSNLISWLTVNPKNKDQWNIGPVDGTFYDGLSGMTLFFYYLYRLTNKAKYERIYRIVLNSAEHKIKEFPNVSGFTGRASLLYPLRKILANEKEDRLARVLNEIIEDCDRQYKTLDQYDWVGGTASLVYQFLDHYLTTRNLDALTLSIKLGNLLIQQLDENDEPMSGFAHGASSLALVLIRLGEIAKNRKFKERGLMLLEYDRSKINAGKEDSTINDGIFKESWCHGTTGVGLSRIKLSRIYTDPWLDDEIDRSIYDLFKSKFHGDDCLCHGNMGSTELFLSKYEVSGEKRYLYTARKIAIDIINKAEKRGHYQVRSIPGFTAIGLFTGLSGIGYQLLRLADHKTVPSVLTLD
ncbi:type 2 lanthipeptide synthetase LanM [Thermicanus aegyptius]|uniref:type 2 lanthipeptide synthetase LanM n=1 Tax=Thermicanus aegyptius TaxID=94009 RepID=UPI00040FDFCF|nr:type 2 lanthipeptide synthetase LanM [Thermicanus aegyptius]